MEVPDAVAVGFIAFLVFSMTMISLKLVIIVIQGYYAEREVLLPQAVLLPTRKNNNE